MNKKGLSAVIISMLLVALAIIITGILWVAISNLVTNLLDDISVVRSEVKATRTEYHPESQTWRITLNNIGRERPNVTITGFRFLFHDERESWKAVKRMQELQAGERKTYYILRAEMGNKRGVVKEIEIFPIVKEDDKPEREIRPGIRLKPESEVVFLPAKDYLERLKAMAWWRFNNGTANELNPDENNLYGNISYGTGTFGPGAVDGTGQSSFISVNMSQDLNWTLARYDFTISFFWRQENTDAPMGGLGNNTGNIMQIDRILNFLITDRTRTGTKTFPNIGYNIYTNNSGRNIQARYSKLNFREEYHMVIVCKKDIYAKIYINSVEEGVLDGCPHTTNHPSHMSLLGIRARGTMLDEMVIFNKTLSDWEVRNIYGIDYNY